MNSMFFKSRRREYNHLTMEERADTMPFFSYPRPQLKRDSFLCLNGKWDDGATVPFPLGSAIAGNGEGYVKQYVYKRKFTVPQDFIKDRVLLHIGAADNFAKVFVDGEEVGSHAGGYLPFSFDITRFGAGEHSLRIEIKDETDTDWPYGKQTLKPGGMWYTPVSGIWGSVWLESVPRDYITDLRITPSMSDVRISVSGGTGSYRVRVYDRQNPAEGRCILETETDSPKIALKFDDPMLWSPEEPNLYGLVISSGEDEVTSYFALRSVDIRNVGGFRRICLNGRPYFFHGVLDQGYFPEGIFLPNSEKGYEQDILKMKELGINTLRKHIKVEPECFYEACDRLGMIVFQDMVNNGKYSFLRDTALPTVFKGSFSDRNRHKKGDVRKNFLSHSKAIVKHLYNHPCVCYYTIFNEGWGQFESDRVYEKFREWDDTRIVDSTSGWFKQKKSDVESIHCYFKPIKPVRSDLPIVVSEMGGYSV
ncbi:MAG: glycoside hydrolase family 2, partial [Lachnospiraceae bacterium]|nr:glycoside hydrolase family 2 [Lachnospiraceae bacterium]